MDDFVSYISGGGLLVMILAYLLKSFFDKNKEKENRLNKNDIVDALQDYKISDHETRITKLENKTCGKDCNK